MDTMALPGTAYRAGDHVSVELPDGTWTDAVVEHVAPIIGVVDFGRRWMLTLHTDTDVYMMRPVDDDGRNHTVRQRVRESTWVAA